MTPQEALAKVQKLLALARSDNVHEASVAAGLAQKLMARYRIDQAMLDAEGKSGEPEAVDPASVDLVDGVLALVEGGRQPSWHWPIVSAVVRANRVHAWWGHGAGWCGRGTRDDLATASYLVGFVFREVDRLAEKGLADERRRGVAGGRAWASSFRLGAATGVHQAIHEARERAEEEARERATDPLKAMELDYREAALRGDTDAILALDAQARDLPRDGGAFALARVETAIARVQALDAAIRERAEAEAKEAHGLKPRRRTVNLSRADAYSKGVKAGKTINLSNPSRRLS